MKRLGSGCGLVYYQRAIGDGSGISSVVLGFFCDANCACEACELDTSNDGSKCEVTTVRGVRSQPDEIAIVKHWCLAGWQLMNQ